MVTKSAFAQDGWQSQVERWCMCVVQQCMSTGQLAAARPLPRHPSYNNADPPWLCRRRRPGASCPALPPSSGTASLPSTPLPPAPSSLLLLRPPIRRPLCPPASPGGVTGSTPLAVADGCSGGAGGGAAAAAARHTRDAGWGRHGGRFKSYSGACGEAP